LKNEIVESQGSGLQNYLLEVCKEEEYKLHQMKMGGSTSSSGVADANFSHSGMLPSRSLIHVLSSSNRLSLSRLQVLVLMSEAAIEDGNVNYFQFIPIVAKAIEIMFDPRALRQRAELIEKTDLSSEALVKQLESDTSLFEQRLLTLFKSYDIDKTGGLVRTVCLSVSNDTRRFSVCYLFVIFFSLL
jgi:hypothetical protein